MRRVRFWRAAALAPALLACGTGESSGGLTEDYIRSDRFTGLVVEVDKAPSVPVSEFARDELALGLAPLLDKPAGVSVVIDDETLPGPADGIAWTFDELRALAKERFDYVVDANTVKIHTLWVSGGYYSGGDSINAVLELAWSNRYIAMFADSITAACLGRSFRATQILCAVAQLSIWTHEVGHVLGLVNNGTSMQEPHEALDAPGHDVREDCVMFASYDRADILSALEDRIADGTTEALGFQEQCLADIAAVRNR